MAPLIIILITAVFGLYMAWNIGANDVANSMAAAVGSRSISIKKAIVAAAICEFAGAVLVGSHVTETVRKGIVNPSCIADLPGLATGEAAAVFAIGMTAALLAAAVWLNIATWLGMPVSTTHSIVGAVAGFGIIAAGWHSVNWIKMGQIVASWFISPVAGGILGYILFKVISVFILGKAKPARAAVTGTPFIAFFVTVIIVLATCYKGMQQIAARCDWMSGNNTLALAGALGVLCAVCWRAFVRRRLRGKDKLPLSQQLEHVEMIFAPLVIATSCCVAFAHGANDVANAVGPLAAVVYIIKECSIDMNVPVPFWVLALGGVGIVAGLSTYGYKVIDTVGTKITQITPSRGVAASVAATTTVLVCTRMKLPVSTTHTLVGAVFGIGLARGLAAVNRDITKDICTSWLITVPAAGLMSILFFLVGHHFVLETIIGVVKVGPR